MSDKLQKKRSWMLKILSAKDEEKRKELLLEMWKSEMGIEVRVFSLVREGGSER